MLLIRKRLEPGPGERTSHVLRHEVDMLARDGKLQLDEVREQAIE